MPELDLDVPRKRSAPKARASPEAEEPLELAVDPRALVLERSESASKSVRPIVYASTSPVPSSPETASAASLIHPSAVVAGVDLVFDARLLAEYGESPRHWALSPLYAYRVFKRRRELKASLGGRREEEKRTVDETENALVLFADRVRAGAEGTATYAAAIAELRRAEEALRSRDQVLASEQDAQRSRLVQADARLASLEAELVQAQRDERAVAAQVTEAHEALSREESKLKRAEIELRAASQRGQGG